ncbi:MAG TPA: OmpA family protein [Bacillota bacterium]|nr:OmpA family protein [Bacillota bacterium]
MKRFIILLFLLLGMIGIAGSAFADPDDAEGSKDLPYFNRMPGYYINDYEDKTFDSVEFKTTASKLQQVEGHHYNLSYSVKSDAQTAGPVQIIRNYINAAKGIGGQVIYSTSDDATLKILKNNIETWVYIGVYNGGELYKVEVVERQAMNQDISANAAALAQSIKNSGKAAIYGIYFDTGKSDMKPESEPALQEIAKLLRENPQLKLYVVGHTDNQGGIDNNIKLSQDRANSVVKKLVTTYAVNAARLKAYGVGPLAPAASNLTEEGRAKNRRVELVAQ